MQGDGQNEQGILGAPPVLRLEQLRGKVGEQAVHGHQKENAQGGAAGGGQPAGQTQCLGLLNGRNEQGPHAGRDHHPGGKAQHDAVEVGGDLIAEQENHGRPQSGHKKGEAGSAAGPKKCLSQEKNSFPGRSGTKTPADVIEGALSQPMTEGRWGCACRAGGTERKKIYGKPLGKRE